MVRASDRTRPFSSDFAHSELFQITGHGEMVDDSVLLKRLNLNLSSALGMFDVGGVAECDLDCVSWIDRLPACGTKTQCFQNRVDGAVADVCLEANSQGCAL